MRIAQVAPLVESCPPALYGGTERVVSYLTEELVRLGHTVTLFASGDSVTAAELVPCSPRALRLDPARPDPLAQHLVMIDRVAAMAAAFDIIHFHTDMLQLLLFSRLRQKIVTTTHGRLDTPGLARLFATFPTLPLVSISDSQRRPVPDACWAATIPHGLPADLYRPGDGQGGYLAFVGRTSPEKGIEDAIAIARRAGMRLRIAAKVDAADAAYFAERVEPLLAHPLVEFVGELDDRGKAALLGGARALLFPIDWPEPFGLVMIEAMASGTPVIAYPRGSVPEILEDGLTGRLVEGIDAAVAAVAGVAALDRRRIRQRFEERFTAGLMARRHVELYRRLIGPGRPSQAAAPDTVAA
ncbi:MAG: glycosyltransferase family 4 protein [Geminicoccaceae bacterium]